MKEFFHQSYAYYSGFFIVRTLFVKYALRKVSKLLHVFFINVGGPSRIDKSNSGTVSNIGAISA